jgi:hypothetical protein
LGKEDRWKKYFNRGGNAEYIVIRRRNNAEEIEGSKSKNITIRKEAGK